MTQQSDTNLISTSKIWDKAHHSAFTDLIEFQNTLYLVFRESDCHAGGSHGVIRLLTSPDGVVWSSVKEFAENDVDLRDPKLSITPDNKLMLLACGTMKHLESGEVTRKSQVAFSIDGHDWTPFQRVLPKNEWLWRVTWHEGVAYGVSYRVNKERWPVTLWAGDNGIDYEKVKEFDLEGKPNETTLRFLNNSDMVALMRRGNYPIGATLIGVSSPPYEQWSWQNTKKSFGGPDFVILRGQEMWACGRTMKFDEQDNLVERTTLAKMDLKSLTPVMDLPSGGEDTSYPGMAYKDGILWISYYSSHDGKTAIYLAKVRI